MRLRSLELLRYGRFESASLDSGQRKDGPDVAIVLGPNESGKSTAFEAWLEFLFGFEHKTTQDFRFAAPDLLVGATVEVNGEEITLRRRKGRGDTLSDFEGRPVSDIRITRHLHGLSREAYSDRFSINDGVLRRGGAAIAEAQGDLGQMLHAGISGLGGVADNIAALHGAADAYSSPGGRKRALDIGKTRIAELNRDIRAARLDPRTNARRAEAQDVLEQAAQAAEQALRNAADAATRHEAALAVIDLRSQIGNFDDRIGALPAGPPLPPRADAEMSAIRERRTQATAAAERAGTAVTQAREKLGELTPDPDGLLLGSAVSAIQAATADSGTAMLDFAAVAVHDLIRVNHQRDEKASARSILCGTLPPGILAPLPDPDALTGALSALGEARILRGAAERAVENVDGETPAAAAVAAGPGPLDAALEAWPSDGPMEEARRSLEDVRTAEETAAAGLPDDYATLPATTSPPEPGGLACQRDLALGYARDAEAAASRQVTAELELGRLERVRADLPERAAAANVEDVATSRSLRDAAWTRHRGDFAVPTADAFEAALSDHDAPLSRFHEGDIERIRWEETTARLADACDEAAEAGAEAERTLIALDASEAVRRRLAIEAGLGHDADWDTLAARQARLVAMRETIADRQAAERLETRLRNDWEEGRDRVREQMGRSGGADPVDAMLRAAARGHLSTLREAAIAVREARVVAERRVKVAADLTAARAAEEDALEVLAAVAGAALTPEEARGLPPKLRALAVLDGEIAALDDRLTKMTDGLDRLERLAADLPAQSGAPADALTRFRAAEARLKEAERSRDEITALETRIVSRESELKDAEQVLIDCKVTIDGLLHGQDGGEMVLDALLQRDILRDERATRVSELGRAVARHAEDALAAAVDTASRAGEGAALASALEVARATHTEAIGEAAIGRRALEDLRGGEGAAAVVQQRAVLIEELAAGAHSAIASRAAAILADAALSRFRRENRSGMLDTAQAIFARLTTGDWPEIEAGPDGRGGERIVAKRDDIRARPESLSYGTRAQLYLAFRLAGYDRFTQDAGPLPFVADDILESFDDGRAEAALGALRELGRHGQAILFTHHAHIAKMAIDTVPGARIMEMPE